MRPDLDPAANLSDDDPEEIKVNPTSYTPEDLQSPALLLGKHASVVARFTSEILPNFPSDDEERAKYLAYTDITFFRYILDRWLSRELTASPDDPYWIFSRELNTLSYSDFVLFFEAFWQQFDVLQTRPSVIAGAGQSSTTGTVAAAGAATSGTAVSASVAAGAGATPSLAATITPRDLPR